MLAGFSLFATVSERTFGEKILGGQMKSRKYVGNGSLGLLELEKLIGLLMGGFFVGWLN